MIYLSIYLSACLPVCLSVCLDHCGQMDIMPQGVCFLPRVDYLLLISVPVTLTQYQIELTPRPLDYLLRM